RGDYHHDAGVPRPLDGEVKGVGQVTLRGVGSEREVEDPDAVGVLEGHDPLEGGKQTHQVGAPVGAGDLDRDEAGAWRDALHAAGGGGALPGDQPSDERSVAVGVDVVLFRREVLGVEDLPGEVAGGVDAGVDDGNVDPLPGV